MTEPLGSLKRHGFHQTKMICPRNQIFSNHYRGSQGRNVVDVDPRKNSNGHAINDTTTKPRAAGKENYKPVAPTMGSCPPKESTRLRSALYRVKSRIQEPAEPDEQSSNEPHNTCEELRKTNELLAKLIPHVSKTQRRVAALEEKLDTSISSSTSSGSSKKCS